MIINTGQRTDIPGYWVAIRHFQLQATILEIYGVDCIDEGFIDGQLLLAKQVAVSYDGLDLISYET